jgi:hypothetical protein
VFFPAGSKTHSSCERHIRRNRPADKIRAKPCPAKKFAKAAFWHDFCNIRGGGSAMEFTFDESNSYRVEVSGWDQSETFFVEKTSLDWLGEEKKEITLRAILREGCVVFVRLIQPLAKTASFPIAYQAAQIDPTSTTGAYRVRLKQLRPRASHRQTLNLTDGAIKVA